MQHAAPDMQLPLCTPPFLHVALFGHHHLLSCVCCNEIANHALFNQTLNGGSAHTAAGRQDLYCMCIAPCDLTPIAVVIPEFLSAFSLTQILPRIILNIAVGD